MQPGPFRFFLHPQRSFDLNTYRSNFDRCMKVCDERNIPGMLISSSGADFYDPWIMSQYFLEHTKNTTPVIAINPVYTHPFTAARMVVSLSELYKRKLYLNFVIGSDLIDLRVIGDELGHDERYQRMDEFIHIFKSLVFSRKKFTYIGQYFNVENISLLSKLDEELLPEFFVAGHSEAGVTLAKKYEVLNLQMLPDKNPGEDISDKIFALSVVCRETAEIDEAIKTQFPKDRFGEILYQQTMTHTDSQWKQEVFENLNGNESNSLFRPEPVRYKYTDNPCLAGSQEEIKSFFKPLIDAGLRNVLVTYNNDLDLDNFIEALSF